MQDTVNKLQVFVNEYLDMIALIGNECAYTDRIIEDIISTSKKLEEEYENQFKDMLGRLAALAQ